MTQLTGETAPPIEISSLSADERMVVHGALLAQVDDAHAGGVYSWRGDEYRTAARLVSLLTGSPVDEAPSGYGRHAAVVKSLLVPIYDLDHPDLEPDEWEEAERILALLSEEFGR